MTLNCKGELINLKEAQIMGILNLTPDSFYENSRLSSVDQALKRGESMLKDGATFLDVGGYSSRPGADEVSLDEELKRTIPVIEALNKTFTQAYISIDTFRSKVAKQAIDAGACIINDISAGSMDTDMFKTVASLKVPYILMHMQGTPQNMQENSVYNDVVSQVNYFISDKINTLLELEINDIVIDPGFGFGKTVEHNFQLARYLNLFQVHKRPLLVGVSRKSMVYKSLNIKPSQALHGTTALHMFLLQKGANILRVHDVKAARAAISLHQRLLT